MVVNEIARMLEVHARFDIPRVRAELRIHLMNAQFSPMLIGRAVTIFTGLSDALFRVNGDQKLEITLTSDNHGQRSVQLQGAVPGAASTLKLINDYTETLQRIVDTFEVLPEDGYLQVKVVLVER